MNIPTRLPPLSQEWPHLVPLEVPSPWAHGDDVGSGRQAGQVVGPHSRRGGADSGYQHHSGNPGMPQKSLFLQGRTLRFCLLGEQPVQGPAVWTGWGRCPGARAAAPPGTASVLGDHVTPTPGLYYSRWPWALGISADFWDVLDSDHPCSVHLSTHAHLHPQPVSVICRWDNFPLSFTPMGVFSRLLGGHSVGFPEG